MHEYYPIPNALEIPGQQDLVFSRSIALAKVVEQDRNTEPVSTWQLSREDQRQLEFLVVDIQCDGVPPNNKFGIEYQERLALVVPKESGQLVEVWTLRKDFPLLMHQNDSPTDTPISLCLYFEPVVSVLRTWTPQAFVRRIKWWLEATSRGELHPADQPVEQLFFASPYELILPWNYEQLRETGTTDFEIRGSTQRSDGGASFLLQARSPDNSEKTKPIEILDINAPPIIQGQIERSPRTFGELSGTLEKRGVDIANILREKIESLVSSEGTPLSSEASLTIVLLHFPIAREQDGAIERIQHRAFLIEKGFLTLGLRIGALIQQPGNERCFRDVMGGAAPASLESIRNEPISFVGVLASNDRDRSRAQSGIVSPGPKGVVVGAGSLGGTLLGLWGRSGWGEWTVVDKDHIKPHNLSRHPASFFHIGSPKTEAVAHIQELVSDGASTITSIFGDVLDVANTEIRDALTSVEMVVDVSTTLEYPRYASTNDDFARHASAFVTPNGHSAVLLVEDSERNIRLRTLEAQYLRLLINNDWGRDHFGLSTSTFWSGVSCRDISTVLSYSKITNHSGNLAEQIQTRTSKDNAFIGIWSRDADTGTVAFRTVPPSSEHEFEFGNYQLFIDDGVLANLRQLREHNLPSETGGVLLGYYDFNVQMVVIVDCLPAPEDSMASRTMFERGIEGLKVAIDEISVRTAGVVQYVGEWHSHPVGSSSAPSQDDLLQLSELAIGMNEDGLPGIVMIIGENEISFLHGIVNS